MFLVAGDFSLPTRKHTRRSSQILCSRRSLFSPLSRSLFPPPAAVALQAHSLLRRSLGYFRFCRQKEKRRRCVFFLFGLMRWKRYRLLKRNAFCPFKNFRTVLIDIFCKGSKLHQPKSIICFINKRKVFICIFCVRICEFIFERS